MELVAQIDELLNEYQELSYDNEKKLIWGEIQVYDGDFYSIEIYLGNYPKFFPTVFEVGDRIPRKAHRHIYTDTGSCCLTTAAKSQVLLKTSITSLIIFFEEVVVRYFENNSYYELKGRYCTEEYSHDSLGVVESYRDILGIDDDILIAKAILDRISGIKLRGYQMCYCASGKNLKKCSNKTHYKNYKLLRMIDIEVLTRDLYTHFRKHLKV